MTGVSEINDLETKFLEKGKEFFTSTFNFATSD